MQTPLHITLYRFRFQAVDPIRLPQYPGSALRGIFGHGLRKTACVTDQPRCDNCMLLDRCPYIDLFDTRNHAPGAAAHVHGQDAPHPLVLDVNETAGAAQAGAGFATRSAGGGVTPRERCYEVAGGLLRAIERAAGSNLSPGTARMRFGLSAHKIT